MPVILTRTILSLLNRDLAAESVKISIAYQQENRGRLYGQGATNLSVLQSDQQFIVVTIEQQLFLVCVV